MKYQLTCPKCKHEFAYDSGHIDSEIARLSAEVTSLIRQLSEHNLLPKDEQYRRTAWWKRTKARLAKAQEELANAKSFRKVADQQVDKIMMRILKDFIKEELGEEAYKRVIENAEKEMEAYNVADMMKHEYSKASYKTGATSINKL